MSEESKNIVIENSLSETVPDKDRCSRRKKVKKIILTVIVLILIFVAWKTVQKFSDTGLFGYRSSVYLEKVKFEKYSHSGPDFSFQYPDHYVFDDDADKKFGADYLAGFRLKSDQRTGCDMRHNLVGLNFSKSDAEITSALEKELSKNAQDFKLLSAKRINIGGEPAFRTEFSFTDPIASTVRLSQNIVSHDGQNYLIVCGTGDYQYKFFQKDFDAFFQSFRWEAGK